MLSSRFTANGRITTRKVFVIATRHFWWRRRRSYSRFKETLRSFFSLMDVDAAPERTEVFPEDSITVYIFTVFSVPVENSIGDPNELRAELLILFPVVVSLPSFPQLLN